MKKLTARNIARHGWSTRYDVMVKSPYSGKLCRIVEATESGSRVTLVLDTGFSMFVNARQEILKVSKKEAV